ncbi:MAG: lipoprotein-releasing ABC transporter permease subunit [Deltaproteobacteria bacterium]|nr:lipoprotein-releasing ABC transporter permease subunit [Deltaproteobacteria bacterium]
MLFELFLSLRYLRAKRKQAFISVISLISIVGVTVGIMALIVVLSVMNGFRKELISKSLGITPHIRIQSYTGSIEDYDRLMEEVKSVDGVIETSAAIFKEAGVTASYTTGVYLSGINPETINRVTDINSMMMKGDISSLDKTDEDLPGIILGNELAKTQEVDTGDTLTVISPAAARLTPLGRIPRRQKFRVTGIFSSGLYEYDVRLAFVSFHEAQKLFGIEGRANQVNVKVNNAEKSFVISSRIRNMLGSEYWVQDWTAANRSILDALKLEKHTMFVILAMIVMVGALNIISGLVMTVIEKSRDIAILRTMGATKKSIMTVFMIQGLFVGIVGTLAGVGLGLGICYLLKTYLHIPIPVSDVYPVTNLPVLVDWADVMVVVTAGLFLSFLTTIYPSWHASRLNPVETLRYE